MSKQTWQEKLTAQKERQLDHIKEENQKLKDTLFFIGQKLGGEWKDADADYIRTQLTSILVKSAISRP